MFLGQKGSKRGGVKKNDLTIQINGVNECKEFKSLIFVVYCAKALQNNSQSKGSGEE